MNARTELSLGLFSCASVGPAEANAIAAAHNKPAPALKLDLNMLQPSFIKPAPRVSSDLIAISSDLAMPGTLDLGIARWKRRHN
jgi:hypothetical protein